jgi:hypothetical protein
LKYAVQVHFFRTLVSDVRKNARVVSAGLSVPTVCERTYSDRQPVCLTQTPVPLESSTIPWYLSAN